MLISIRRFNAEDMRAHKDEFVELLRDVVDGGSSVNFIAPLDLRVAAAAWERWAGEVDAGQRIVLAALDANRVVGCVHLVLAMQPNGLHRADVQKVLVHSRARRQGIATQLMGAIEDEARSLKRSLLVLDTQKDSGAEILYGRIGYVRMGVIPQFALDSTGKQLIDAVFFYKLL
jgi:acetyltransferase